MFMPKKLVIAANKETNLRVLNSLWMLSCDNESSRFKVLFAYSIVISHKSLIYLISPIQF